jgi:hypothetical protein
VPSPLPRGSSAKAGDTFTLTSTAAGTLTLTRGSDSVAQTVTVNALGANGSGTLDFSTLGVKITLQADSGGKTAAGIVTDLTAAANDTIVTAAGTGSANFQTGAYASDFISVSFTQVDISATGLSALDTALANFNTTQSVANSQALMTALDTAISSVNSNRSNLGAVQNRLEHTITNIGVAHENLTASESRIRDADMSEDGQLHPGADPAAGRHRHPRSGQPAPAVRPHATAVTPRSGSAARLYGRAAWPQATNSPSSLYCSGCCTSSGSPFGRCSASRPRLPARQGGTISAPPPYSAGGGHRRPAA